VLLQRARENGAAPKTFASRAFAPLCAAKLALRLPRALYNSTRRANQPPRKVHSHATACRSLSSAPPTSRRRRRPSRSPSRRATSPADEMPPRRRSSSGYRSVERSPTAPSTRRSTPARSASASAPSRRRTRRRARTTRSPGASAARTGR
jgi:hypothetical protein